MINKDFKINTEYWDIDISDNDLSFVEGPEMTAQNSTFRVNIIAGEMFDDTRQGVPWLTDMISPEVSIQAKKQIIRSVLQATPGAISIDEINMTVSTSGASDIKWKGTCSGGTFESEINT